MEIPKSKELDVKYFSREFPKDTEVEWKGALDTHDPVGFILWLEELLHNQELPDFKKPTSLGSRNTAMGYQALINHYYGYRDTEGELRQAFVLIQPPGSDVFAPHIKFDDGSKQNESPDAILIRRESKPGRRSFVPINEQEAFINDFSENVGVEVEYVGTMRRERSSTFASGINSHRNWSVVADMSYPLDDSVNSLAQVEVEYKGRNGVWLEENQAYQQEALAELRYLSGILMEEAGPILRPSCQTKFEWLIAYNENSTSL